MRMNVGEILQHCQLNFSQQPPIKMGGFGGREGGGVKPVHKDGSLVPYIVGTCPPPQQLPAIVMLSQTNKCSQ